MPRAKENTYDAVIIGAGISGLVCGCYLAKAGMKVLIAEQHSKPGGYCTSFKRQGFTFDAAAHSLGGFRYGNIGKIFEDLGVDRKIKIGKSDPSDIVITPDYKISIWSDLDKTIEEFGVAFPKEKENIKILFNLLINPKPNFFVSMRSKTFIDLLDQYLTNDKLKAILSFLLLGNGGVPHCLMSAFMGAKIFKEFILDGGYYPEGGIQVLPAALAERFKELGGTLIVSSLVKKIKIRDHKITGILLEGRRFIPSRYVVSNCDARQTFLKLLGEANVSKEFSDNLKKMKPSLSGFMLYLAVDENFNKPINFGCNIWYLKHYDADKAYWAAEKGKFDALGGFVLHLYPDNQRILAFMNAPFKNNMYWKTNKTKIADYFISMIESDVIPGLSKHIIYKEAATPHTLYRYTLNYKGATYGWAGIPSQFADADLKKPSFIKNLYLTGHWTTHGMGIPGVAYIGHDIAKSIMKRYKNG